MKTNDLLYLVGGLVVGAVGGFFAGKYVYGTKYQKQYEKDIKAMETYYGKVDEYAGKDKDKNSLFDEEDEINPEEYNNTLEGKREIREKLRKNYKETTNYANMYKIKQEAALTEEEMRDLNAPLELGDTDPAEEESPEDDVDDSDQTEEYHDHHQSNKNRKPRIIALDSIGDVPGYYETETLFFYFEDCVLATEEGEVIEDPELFIGDALTKYDFENNDEEIIYVQNFQLDKIYEVQKILESYRNAYAEEE